VASALIGAASPWQQASAACSPFCMKVVKSIAFSANYEAETVGDRECFNSFGANSA
jgi:hypothetical protein